MNLHLIEIKLIRKYNNHSTTIFLNAFASHSNFGAVNLATIAK